MKEEWRDIYYYNKPTEEWIDYRGMYQVSNYGELRSVDRYVRGYNHGKEHKKLIKGQLLVCRQNCCGYTLAHLSKEGKHRDYSLHRLVYFSFNPDADTTMEVNHINEIKTDCRLDNLNLMLPSDNCRWGTRTKRIKEKTTGVSKGPMPEWHKEKIKEGQKNSEKMKAARKVVGLKNSKAVVQLTLEGEYVNEYVNAGVASQMTGVNAASINMCACGHRKTAGTIYKWVKAVDYYNTNPIHGNEI